MHGCEIPRKRSVSVWLVLAIPKVSSSWENESILVSVFPLAFTVVEHFITLPLTTMGLIYSN